MNGVLYHADREDYLSGTMIIVGNGNAPLLCFTPYQYIHIHNAYMEKVY